MATKKNMSKEAKEEAKETPKMEAKFHSAKFLKKAASIAGKKK